MCRKGRKELPKGDFFYALSLQPIGFYNLIGPQNELLFIYK